MHRSTIDNFKICLDKTLYKQAVLLWPDLPIGQAVSIKDWLIGCKALARCLEKMGMKKAQFWSVQGLDAFSTLTIMMATWINKAIAVPLNPGITGLHLDSYTDQLAIHGRIDLETLAGCYGLICDEGDRLSVFDLDILLRSDDPAVAIFTSGSSGKPKAIIHSLSSLSYSAEATNNFYDFNANDSWLVSLGLFHVGGLLIVIRSLLAGATVCIGGQLNESINVFKPSFLSLVPSQLLDLLKQPLALKHLAMCRVILVGGAAYSSELLQAVRQHGLPVSFTYGSSESGAQVAATRPGVLPSITGVAGQILPGRNLIVGADGLIRINDNGLMLGYWQDMRFNPIERGAWYTSSDFGRIKDGVLTILGRSDDVYMVGGEGVSLSEVQSCMDKIPIDGRFIALMLPDKRLGFLPACLIEAEHRPDLASILPDIEKYLPSLKRPRLLFWSQKVPQGEKPNRSFLSSAVLEGDFICLWRRSETN